jgi:hypothetical protein
MQSLKREILMFGLLISCGGGSGAAEESGGPTGADSEESSDGPVTGSSTMAAESSGTDGSGTSGTGSGTEVGTSSGSETGPAVTTTEGTETTSVVETTGSTGSTGSTEGTETGTTESGGEESPLVIAIVDAYLNASCEGRPAPDPVWGQWYVDFDNTAGLADTSAVLVGAWLSPADGDPKAEAIMATPTESGPIAAGAYESVELTYLPGAMHSACDHCDEWYKLVVEYDESGTILHAEEDVMIPCSL